jgi:hypothetical protein
MIFPMLALILGGYWLVIVISPFDIYWQVATAFDRLLVQLWPLAIFLVFLAARSPKFPAKSIAQTSSKMKIARRS